MGNGENEKLTFTREDSARLVRIEDKLDEVIKDQAEFEATTNIALDDTVSKKGIKWIIGIMGVLVGIAATVYKFVT